MNPLLFHLGAAAGTYGLGLVKDYLNSKFNPAPRYQKQRQKKYMKKQYEKERQWAITKMC